MHDQVYIGMIDDEESGLSVLQEFIGMIPGFSISFAVSDPVEGLKMACARKADVVISDVKMPGTGGLVIAGKLMELNIPLIFCSAYPEFLRHGYLVDAVDFLSKPVDFLELANALNRAAGKLPAITARTMAMDSDNIYIKTFGSATLEKIELKTVVYMEQKGNYTYIYTEDKCLTSVSTLTQVNLYLSPGQFLKVHRSYVLNVSRVKVIHKDCIELDEGTTIPIGRSFLSIVKSFFGFRTV